MKTTALFAIMIMLVTALQGQTRVVNGKLTTFNTFPVQNVEITSKKAKATTKTDEFGHFSIVCEENDVIKIKPKAFKARQKKVNAETDSICMNLQFIDSEANRQIAVGYGYISEEDLIFAVSHLENENNEFCSYSDIFELIKGQLSGVSVSKNEVYVRGGINSFTPGASVAMYVVDNQHVNSISWLQPCQVKSIDVLKDASASIYGTNAGNGVVLIETMK
jgi:TonB-dependent SusC/RagA subfamily outer membrane receptor